jgi:hypothetical protein
MPNRSTAECVAARSEGFSIANDVDQTLWPLLDKTLACSRAKSRSIGIIAAYGWVYSQWASQDLPVAKPIQTILRGHAVANGVIAPQESILGFYTSPTLSIQQIRSKLGSGHNSTRRRLSTVGHIPSATRRGVKCAIDPNAIRAIQELPPCTSLGTRMIGKKLGIGRGCARDLFVFGLLSSREGARSERAIDDFAVHLIAKCGATPPSEARSVKEAAKNRNVRLANVLSAIAVGQLPAWLKPKSSGQSLAERLMVVPSQIWADSDKSIPLTKAARRLSLHPQAVSQLVKRGLLARIDGRGLSARSVSAFDRSYIALAPVAHARTTTSHALARQLASDHILPAFAPPEFRQIIYNRRLLENSPKHGVLSAVHG